LSRILAIDVGKKKTGIAVTDPLKMFATALTTVESFKLMKFIQEYCKKENVESFVVGLPKNMKNEASDSIVYVKKAVANLEKLFPDKPVYLIDERFTSKIAFQSMIDGGLKKKDRQNKSTVDKVSAVIILQSYLEQKNNNIL